MDCFFAAVEMRDNPKYRQVPLAVGGAEARGVICTSNYLARVFGVKSAMSGAFARKLCPQLVFAPLRFPAYKEASSQVFQILKNYTSKLEGLSLDEAYLDLSDICKNYEDAKNLAFQIKQEIFDLTQLTCSIGISYCKFLAKFASDYKKPNGFFLIDQHNFEDIILPQALIRLPGVGAKTYERLQGVGLKTVEDLKRLGAAKALKLFGDQGLDLYQYACGIDDSTVESEREAKSISVEETFSEDIFDISEMEQNLEKLLPDFYLRLKKFKELGEHKTKVISSFFVKLKCTNFKSYVTTKTYSSHYFENLISDGSVNNDQKKLMKKLLAECFDKGAMPVRLLGLGVKLSERIDTQLSLFESA